MSGPQGLGEATGNTTGLTKKRALSDALEGLNHSGHCAQQAKQGSDGNDADDQ